MISSKLRGLMFSRRRWARTDAWRRLVLVVALVATTSQLVPSSAWSFSTAPVYSHERRRETRIRNGLQFRLHQSNDPSSGSSAEPEEGSPTTSLSPAPAPPPPPQTPLDDKDADPFSFLPAPFLTSEQSEVTFVDFTEDGACVPAGPIGQAKETLANFMDEPIVELTVASVVLVSSLLVAISTLSAMEPYLDTIKMVQTGVGIIFFLDFISRWFSSPKDAGKFILDAFFFVDILVVVLPLAVALTPDSFWAETPLPDWATSPSGLFNLQLFRVLRLRRVLKDISTFEKFQRALPGSGVLSGVQEWQLQLARVLLSLFTLVSVATGLIYTVEHDSNPAISDYFTALYFGLTTLTTVGFGGAYLLCCSNVKVHQKSLSETHTLLFY